MSMWIGRTLRHYRILRPLGIGGMGEVYEAEDTKLERKVALKVLPPDMALDPERRERFEREAKAVAALNHPNIVTIYSVEEADGASFITMELVEGQTLRQTLPRGGLPLDELLDLAIPLAEAVAAAHQRGITHRDLKPENILINQDGKVKVLDFGLAKVVEPFRSAGESSRLPTRALTEEGRVVGTIAYMSPEQAEGKTVDPRSDVFALGVILYELSTGERPFKGDTAVALLSSILRDEPPTVTRINSAQPRDLARIVSRCLMKDPARRFQSALGLLAELTTLKHDSDSGALDAVPTGADRSGVPQAPARNAPRARRIGVAAALAVPAALLVAGYMALRAWRGGSGNGGEPGASPGGERPSAASTPGAGGRPEDGQPRIVVLPFENLGAPDDAYFAAGVTDEIASRLASVRGLGVISRNSAVQYAKTRKTTKEIGRELGVDYLLEGTVRWERGTGQSSRVRVTPQLVRVADDVQLWGDRFDRELKDIFAVQSEIAEQVVLKLGVAVQYRQRRAIDAPPTENLEAYQAYLRGRESLDSPGSSRTEGERAVEMLGRAVQLDPEFALAWAWLSKAHSSLYQYRIDFREDRLAKAKECADRALALQPDLREGRLALGYYYYWGRLDYDRALQEFKLAARGGQGDSEILEAVAYIRRRQGHWDEALASMERAFSLNPRNSILASNMSSTYQRLRRYPEARRSIDIAIIVAPEATALNVSKALLQVKMDGNTRSARETLPAIDPADFPYLPWLEVYLDFLDGKYEEALERMAGIPSDVLDIQYSYTPKPLQIGLIHLAAQDVPRARVACESARRVLEQAIARSPEDARIRAALGMALACMGRKEEALREARLATEIVPVSTDAYAGAEFLQALAQVYTMVGDPDAAIDTLDRLLAIPSDTEITMLRLSPIWAPLWKHPRFEPLMEKYGRRAA